MIDSPGMATEKAVEELIRGREYAYQLKILMENPSEINNGFISKDDLVNKILLSFSHTLSALRNLELDEVSQLPVGSPPSDSRRSDDSGESIRSSLGKSRRGCYKRRKSANSWTREDSPKPFEDGHSWRKYGQKNILRAKHPRNYFRCTHKYDQKCQATKQVEKIRDDPPAFRTTYYGYHTCRDLHHMIIDDSHDGRSSTYLMSFEQKDSNFTFSNQQQPCKQESVDLTASSGDHSFNIVDSSLDLDFDIDAAFNFDLP